MFDNGLTDAELERLALLAEECGEVIRIAGKIICHGYESVDPTRVRAPTNRRMLEAEVADVQFAMSLLVRTGDISRRNIETGMSARLDDPGRYMHHQRQWNGSDEGADAGREAA